jgi:6-phosphofructokinase 1
MAKLAVLTSGGDAPGMNAATRAVVRAAIGEGLEVIGCNHGYTGLIAGDLRPLGLRDVGGIIHRGGTILGTTRCEQLKTARGLAQALEVLRQQEVDALIVIGGNGSQSGAWELSQRGVAVVGIASSIDNDLYGADVSLGATTAVDVALEAVDRLRVTAAAMNRVMLVEVMGRACGYIALMTGIAGGAEAIVVPEAPTEPAAIAAELRAAYDRGKSHAIVVAAEGAAYGGDELLQYFRQQHEALGFDVRMTRLGHVQRGGAPGVFDRMLGTQLGCAAVAAVSERDFGVLIGLRQGVPKRTALSEVAGRARPADVELLKLARLLAR